MRRLIMAGVVAAIVVALDQVTKTWAEDRLASGPVHVIWKLDLQLGFNTGSAFSLHWAPSWLLGVVAGILIGGLIFAVTRSRSDLVAGCLGLVVGGAIGNLSDRLFRTGHHGGVVDFIALHFWPTFNLADSSIVVGALLLALALWRNTPSAGTGS